MRFLVFIAVLLSVPVFAQGQTSVGPTPQQDDSALHDVQFVGHQIGWAVGDHGTVWRTRNGGQAWEFVQTPVDCTWRTVCFLTDRVGWIAGGGTTPYSQITYGIILFTNDGGQSWQVIAKETVPEIQHLKFFGLKEGIAVAESNREFPSGLLKTEDGGQTWTAIGSDKHSGWRAADFLQPEVGVVAGKQGQIKLFGGGRLLATQSGTSGLRNLRAIKLQPNYLGWLAGDGGLLKRTENGGVSWEPPPGQFPEHAQEMMNFRAVACRGNHVWVAGSPGSVVWHSPDVGKTWQKQLTGQTGPILDLEFVSDTLGWAVGAFGGIFHTNDGGQTWHAQRGANRRAAILAIAPREANIPFPLLAKLGLEEGYRAAVYCPARRDLGSEALNQETEDLGLSEAVAKAGGVFAEQGWQLPVTVPGLEQDRTRLIADWNRRTDGELTSVILDDLIRKIRVWRPNIIVLAEEATNDAWTRFLNQAVMHAVKASADPTISIHLQEHGGLRPWQVQRVYKQLPEGSTGNAKVDAHELLARVGMSVQAATALPRAILITEPDQSANTKSYRLIFDAEVDVSGFAHRRDFFAGMSIAPGSPARRNVLPVRADDQARPQELLQKQRNFQAYVQRLLSNPRHAAQAISHVRQQTAGMTTQQASQELLRLANLYRKQSRWDLVEATYVEMLERYPKEAASHEAMTWLFQLWTSAEPAWQRSRKTTVHRGVFQNDANTVMQQIQNAIAASQGSSSQDSDANLIVQTAGLQITKDRDWRTGAVANWQEQAVQLAALIRQTSPALFLQPEIQFPLATLMRQRGVYRLSDSYYRRFQRLGEGDEWKSLADIELWLANPVAVPPRKVVHCLGTRKRPRLDGVLSETCWQAATILPLENPTGEKDSTASESAASQAFVMLCYDEEFLYLAASIPRVKELPGDPVQLGGRTHDADLSGFDQITLALDVDRDYATWYELSMDQRGWTRDECWQDAGWDPKWFVAAAADESRWRIEAAIPFKELVAEPPKPGATWSLGVVRKLPAVGYQGWPHAVSGQPRAEGFGILKFH